MKKSFVTLLGFALLISGATPLQPAYAASSITVDLSAVIGPATHAGSGSLYGVIESKPDNSLILPLRIKALNNPAVAGHQQPWGAAVPVAQRVAPMGTKVSIRLADWYGGWYSYTNLTDWFGKMTQTVNDVKAANLSNVYGYELWNEPDGTFHGKYVASMDASDSYAQITVQVPTAGTYPITIRYANGTGNNATQSMSVNGEAAKTVTFPKTGGWFVYYGAGAASLSMNLTLKAGSNTVRLTKGGTGSVELDYLEVTAGGAVKRYEFEDGTVNNSTVKVGGHASSTEVGNMTFNEFYSVSQKKLKQLDPTAKAIGPSFMKYTHNGLYSFLSYQKSQGTLPDLIGWHELSGDDVTQNITDYRTIEASLGISPLPISLNEYGQNGLLADEGVPGSAAPMIAKFERLQVDSAMISYWDVPHPGRLGSLLATDTDRNGGWWFYKWYGDMTGNMVKTVAPNPAVTRAVDSFANVDADRKFASILFGGETDGSVNVTINHFPAFFGSRVHVRLESTPYASINSIVNTTTTLWEGDYALSGGQLMIPVSGMNSKDGYRITLTPSGQPLNKVEAEDAAVNHANRINGANASAGKYVGQIDYSDSYVDFYVKVPVAGDYVMSTRYANGTGSNATHQLTVNRGTPSTVTYAPTAGWGQFDNVNVNVNLAAGDNVIRLSKGSTGYAELDSIEIMPAAQSVIQSGHVYKLTNVNSNKVLGVSDMSLNDGANAVQWGDTGTSDHEWKIDRLSSGYYKLTNMNSGKVLGIAGMTGDSNANAVQWEDNGSADHEWQIIPSTGGSFKLVNRNSGKLLGVTGMSTSDGAQVIQWGDTGTPDHNWTLTFVR
ncbi:RICIN domain-containing protein [Gorillibacterium sp. sgz500922]|uniref:RICIN domain-containing protein n=1 Tax=Gorillibacterium sp. sgz500922 TaxID=3446694 RepID=UPI003F663FA8